ncbi:hypothetical protein [Enterococcus gilvus]|uniref:hypothetical protein n=1 Tax=Enterococcus gilvus TaxID=160453 RepID=UPI003ED8A9FC
MLKDTEEHLAETMRLGPGYYRIRERYDYAIESDERYIEKLRKQIVEYDQAALNKSQQVVLEWLKSNSNALKVPMLAIYELAGLADEKVRAAYRQLNREEEFQVLAAFAEWGKEEVAE